MIFERASDIIFDDVFLKLPGFLSKSELLVKIEGLNVAKSIKLKTAKRVVAELEQSGQLRPGATLIESSSGNFGIALAIICAERGYKFVCVCDPNALSRSIALMKAYGATVEIISKRDANGGYLQSRIDFIQERLLQDPTLVWSNQYGNKANSNAHRDWTAMGILNAVPHVHSVFVGIGTTGTLMGVLEAVQERAPQVRLYAVDVEGSVTFGLPASPRFIPGMGASRRPELFAPQSPIERVTISEEETVKMNRELLARWSFLAGGSTGTVLAAVRKNEGGIPAGATVVAISPDLGDGYLDTIFNDHWVNEKLPGALRDPYCEAA